MAFKSPEQTVVEVDGYITASKHTDVDDIYRELANAIEESFGYYVEESYPPYVYDQNVFKVTIKVEKK